MDGAFVRATNGALLSSHGIRTAAPEFIRTYGSGADTGYALPGYGELAEKAYATGALFSELGAPWASPGQAVATDSLTRIDFSPWPGMDGNAV